MIRAQKGFNPMQVSWGGPDEPRTETCSYCGNPLQEDQVPLILWDKQGWCAEFCDKCQDTCFGMMRCDEQEDDDER